MTGESEETAPNTWLDDVRGRLGEKSEAIGRSLEDVAAVVASSGAKPEVWIHLDEEADAPSAIVTAWIVAQRGLHRLRGPLDRPVSRAAWDEHERESKCVYDVLPLTAECSVTMSLTIGGVGERAVVHREWQFQLEAESLTLVSREPPAFEPLHEDPGTFARALAAEIMTIRGGGAADR